MQLYDIQEPGASDDNILKGKELKNIIGIDLGTTNSLVAIVQDQELNMIECEGSPIVPSVVSYSDNKVCVGSRAQEQTSYISSVKRLIGTDNLANNKTAVEVSADILSFLKYNAEKQLGESIDYAVITVPAYFNWVERKETKQAAKLAGLEVVRLINEPTAAAFAYGLNRQQYGTYLVYDLGGGTFDVSILNLHKGVFEVLATGGDVRLGGDDIDSAILSAIKNKVEIGDVDKQSVLKQIRLIKEELSSQDIWEGELVNGLHVSFSKQELNEILDIFIDKTKKIIKKVLKEADLELEDINEVMFVGGSTKSGYIKSNILKFLQKESALDGVDPDKIVAIGAAYQANELTNTDNNNLLLDVTPLSLGIELADGSVEVIIPKNTTLPYEYKKQFATSAEGQTGFMINVIQGEEKKATDCTVLEKFELKGLKPLPAGQAKVEASFRMDVDSILTVSAIDILQDKGVELLIKPFE